MPRAAMPILKSIASGLISQAAARRVGRLIPNPILRFVAITAATRLVPVVADRIGARWQARRLRRAARPKPLGG